jgi:hypothetical protein
VDVRGPKRFLASTANVSLGGLLATTPETFAPDTQIWVRFNLPSGQTVSTQAVVVHSAPGHAMGLRFLGLSAGALDAISHFASRVINHTRRGLRVPRRTHIMLRRSFENTTDAEMAETVLVSRHGGLAICRADFAVDDRLYLWWPERQRGAEVRIIFRHELGSAGLAEVAFEFVDSDNFWEMEFPEPPSLD